MTKTFYETINKLDILSNPSNYAWNCVLYYLQFSQEEIILVKEFIEVRELIRFQKSVTKSFLRKHFQKEIDDSLDVDWIDVDNYIKQ